MSVDLNALLPEFIPYAKAFVQVLGSSRLQPRVTSTRRTRAEQQRLYDAFVSRGGTGLPAAAPGTSAHEYGYAFDLVVSPYDYLAAAGAYWTQLGGIWHATDPVHFEYPGFVPPVETRGESPIWSVIELLSSFLPAPLWLGERPDEAKIRAIAARYGIY